MKFSTGCLLLVYTHRPCLVSLPSRRGRISHSDSNEYLLMLRGMKRGTRVVFNFILNGDNCNINENALKSGEGTYLLLTCFLVALLSTPF